MLNYVLRFTTASSTLYVTIALLLSRAIVKTEPADETRRKENALSTDDSGANIDSSIGDAPLVEAAPVAAPVSNTTLTAPVPVPAAAPVSNTTPTAPSTGPVAEDTTMLDAASEEAGLGQPALDADAHA